MNIYKYEFEYKVYNNDGLEIDKGIETSKGYDEVRAENYLRTRLEEGCQSDEEVELKLIPSFVKYTDANKLIAEFMGDKFSDVAEMKYHTSWDWLMPVVEKCLVGEAEQSEEISNTTIKNIYEGICNQDISFAYQAVVEFINEYNQNA